MKAHLSMEDLLGVRDGEGSREAAGHVASCSHCAGEVERLRDVASGLRALPAPEMEGDRWPEVKAALDGEERAWIPKAVAGTLIAVAASLIVLVVLPRDGSAPGLREGREEEARQEAAVTDEEIAGLVQESQRLEDLLRAASERGHVVDAWSASRVADIQDRVAFIDGQLAVSRPGGVPASRRMLLWRTRVGLMNELVQVRATRPQYVEF